MSPVYEYRVTAAAKYGSEPRVDVSGAGSPFRSDDPMWSSFHEGDLTRVEGLCQAIVEDAVAEGHDDLHIERRVVSPWERVA